MRRIPESLLRQRLRAKFKNALTDEAIKGIESSITQAVESVLKDAEKEGTETPSHITWAIGDKIEAATIKSIEMALKSQVEKPQPVGTIKIVTLENGNPWVQYTINGREYLLHLNLSFDQAQFTRDEQIRRGIGAVVGPALEINTCAQGIQILEVGTKLGVYVEKSKWHLLYAGFHEKNDEGNLHESQRDRS